MIMTVEPSGAIAAASVRRQGIPWALSGLLILLILISTWLHHLHPEVLRVPSATDVSARKNPTFEQTLLYERMTPEERERVRAGGVFFGACLVGAFAVAVFILVVSLFGIGTIPQLLGATQRVQIPSGR